MEQNLNVTVRMHMTFERKILVLTKTFGLVTEDNPWRIRTNAERGKLYMDVNTGRFITPECRRWIGRMMQETPRNYFKTTYTKNDLRKHSNLDVKLMWSMT